MEQENPVESDKCTVQPRQRKIQWCIRIATTVYAILLIPTMIVGFMAFLLMDVVLSNPLGEMTLFFVWSVPISMLVYVFKIRNLDWRNRFWVCLLWSLFPIGLIAFALALGEILSALLGYDVFLLLS